MYEALGLRCLIDSFLFQLWFKDASLLGDRGAVGPSGRRHLHPAPRRSDDGVLPLAGISDDYKTTVYMDDEISFLLKHNDPNITPP